MRSRAFPRGATVLLQIQQPENVSAHFFWIALPIILSLGAGQLATYFANARKGMKKDLERKQAELEKDNRLAIMLENYRLHDHGEWKDEQSEGPLHAENIRFPRSS
jgi:hypothetical protein